MIMKIDGYHNPVLLNESVQGLIKNADGIYVDVTFGGGGHSRKVLSKLGESGRLIGFDQDEDVLENIPDDSRFQLVQNNFRYLKNNLRFLGIKQVDGVLADLGVSSHQFDEVERGFSIRTDAKLDMRMSVRAELSAYDVVNEYSEEKLVEVFRDYGELKNARQVAGKIVFERSKGELNSTGQLVESLSKLAPKLKQNQFLARVFQAIRIEVNKELEALEDLLEQCIDCIKPGGRLVVISYHSLEDRTVKRFMKSGNFSGKVEKDFFGNPLAPFTSLKGMPVVPSDDEIEVNNRARSAKLRIAERNG